MAPVSRGGGGGGGGGGGSSLKKTGTQRKQSNTRVVIGGGVDSSLISYASTGQIHHRRFAKTSSRFNDSVTADVILTLHFEPCVYDGEDVKLYLHSDVLLAKSRYFSALFSDRWQQQQRRSSSSSVDDDDDDDDDEKKKAITFNVPSSMGSFVDTMTIFELFYTTDDDDDDDDFSEAINTTSSALSIINTALPILFEDCIRACIRFLGAVSWSEEEEIRVLSLIPMLKPEESHVLLARFLHVKTNPSDDMLLSMILQAVSPEFRLNSAYSKAFVARFLRDFPSRKKALRCALTDAFQVTLRVLWVSLKYYYSCPYVLTETTEKVQRATSHARNVRWLIDMMIELRVGENAVKEWTDRNILTDAVFKFFREKDNAALGIVAHVIGCTCKLATAVASGSILADTQVRMKLVNDWLPVLIVNKGNFLLPRKSKGEVLLPKKKVLPIFAKDESMYRDLEKAFLRIISTLPMTDSQELLLQCIRLSALNVEESPHLLSAFNTWFRRAQTHQPEKFD